MPSRTDCFGRYSPRTSATGSAGQGSSFPSAAGCDLRVFARIALREAPDDGNMRPGITRPVPASPPSPGVRAFPSRVLELENSSWVVARGVCHTEWFVRVGEAWTRIADVPGASATVADDHAESGAGDTDGFVNRPAGCQYICRYRLTLPIGTAVRRRVSKPREARRTSRGAETVSAGLRRDILTYFRFMKPPVGVVETNFRLTRAGLVSEAQWENAAARRANRAH